MAAARASALLSKHCIVTGGTRGIGLAIAQRFAAEGADITLVSRSPRPDALKTLADHRAYPRQNYGYFQGDVAEQATWQQIAKDVPKPDILVNCAGVSQERLLLMLNPDEAQRIINTNLTSTVLGCRFGVRAMVKGNRGGCIINVSSVLAKMGVEGTSVYAAAKAGILGLTSSLAVEYGRYNVRVNALVPGYIETDMTRNMDPERVAKIQERIPLRRLGLAEEVADAAVFLAKNSYANNCILNVDGGLSAT